MIRAFSAYSTMAGSTRVRLADWFAYLKLTVRHHTFIGQANNRPRTLLRKLPASIEAHHWLHRVNVENDTVIMSREASPFSRGEIEERILTEACHSVYDFDDAIFLGDSRLRKLLGGSDKCARACARADTVVVGNDYLAEWASQHNRQVLVVPSCVDPEQYGRRHHLTPKSEQEPVRLIWIGSRATEKYLAPVLSAVERVHLETGARLTVVSAPEFNPDIDVRYPFIDRVPWERDTFAQRLVEADIGLAPLNDTPFSRGKCAYKILQYGAAGLPMIGSPVGANCSALSRLGGLAASTLDDWVEGLRVLIAENHEGKLERVAAARAGVMAHYSFQAWEDRWATAVLGAQRSSLPKLATGMEPK